MEDFKEVEEILRKGLKKSPDSLALKTLHSKNTNMFIYTVDLMNKIDSADQEKVYLYERLRHFTVEIENLKLKK
jgi:hypothetical protein